VSAREALGAQLSARIDAAEAASERRARETADTAAAASALAVTRADVRLTIGVRCGCGF
jgi:hypothetical protein